MIDRRSLLWYTIHIRLILLVTILIFLAMTKLDVTGVVSLVITCVLILAFWAFGATGHTEAAGYALMASGASCWIFLFCAFCNWRRRYNF